MFYNALGSYGFNGMSVCAGNRKYGVSLSKGELRASLTGNIYYGKESFSAICCNCCFCIRFL